MDVSLVWADDMEEGLVALAVDEEIDQLRLEIASLRREFFVDEEKRPAGSCNAESAVRALAWTLTFSLCLQLPACSGTMPTR
jgi:hypothetical protein